MGKALRNYVTQVAIKDNGIGCIPHDIELNGRFTRPVALKYAYDVLKMSTCSSASSPSSAPTVKTSSAQLSTDFKNLIDYAYNYFYKAASQACLLWAIILLN